MSCVPGLCFAVLNPTHLSHCKVLCHFPHAMPHYLTKYTPLACLIRCISALGLFYFCPSKRKRFDSADLDIQEMLSPANDPCVTFCASVYKTTRYSWLYGHDMHFERLAQSARAVPIKMPHLTGFVVMQFPSTPRVVFFRINAIWTMILELTKASRLYGIMIIIITDCCRQMLDFTDIDAGEIIHLTEKYYLYFCEVNPTSLRKEKPHLHCRSFYLRTLKYI